MALPWQRSASTSASRPTVGSAAAAADLLERSDLFCREVFINDSDLNQDCSDLIGFEEPPRSDVVVLRSTPQGYRLWIPARMALPMPLAQSRDELTSLSPRMLSISPGLQQRDLSALGLLRFAYGEPRQTGLYVISGLLIGVSLGFLLAIGRDVGAARWIFGMGATGALTGTCLGLLSGGFRFGVAVMLLTTLLGLLTPTFNTVITNQALPDRDLGLLLQISGILVAAGVLRVCLQWVQNRAMVDSAARCCPLPAGGDAQAAAAARGVLPATQRRRPAAAIRCPG